MTLKPIENGVVHRLSASLIQTFDASTRFGCERRGWFKYVAHKEEPVSGNQSLGSALHRANEAFLKNKEIESDSAVFSLFSSGLPYLQKIKPAVIGVEHAISLSIGGVPLVGSCDVYTDWPGIIDWKTTTNIPKNRKSKKSLKIDTQMIIYARAIHPDAENVRLVHGYYQTRDSPIFQVVEADVSRVEINEHLENYIVPKIERIKEVAQFRSQEQSIRNPKNCFLCPHKNYCQNEDKESIMSYFKKMTHIVETPAEIPAPAPAPTETLAEVLAITPPDMPKSDPALAADPLPVEKPASILKKRGRPASAAKTSDKIDTHPSTVSEITVNYGLTLNTGNFNSMRFDVTFRSTVPPGSDENQVYEQTLQNVKMRVNAEIQKVSTALEAAAEKK